MKRNTPHLKDIKRISGKDQLPLLRGMFVSPEIQPGKQASTQRTTGFFSQSEDELVLTVDKGYFLGL